MGTNVQLLEVTGGNGLALYIISFEKFVPSSVGNIPVIFTGVNGPEKHKLHVYMCIMVHVIIIIITKMSLVCIGVSCWVLLMNDNSSINKLIFRSRLKQHFLSKLI